MAMSKQKQILDLMRDGWILQYSQVDAFWYLLNLRHPPSFRMRVDGRSVQGLLKRGVISRTSMGREVVVTERGNTSKED